MNRSKVDELLCEALETERGGVRIYETALSCVQNADLRKEWEKFLAESRRHEQILKDICTEFGVNAEQETSGRKIVRSLAETLVKMMQMALSSGVKGHAEIVAAEAVTTAELKDHMNWELIGEVAKEMEGHDAAILKKAYEEVEDQEDRHFYHSRGWARELWVASLGVPAVIPPPEEKMNVKSGIGAATAQGSRKLI
ncbi:MAG: hypothetical protein ACYCXX_02930 [Acidiferrobacter thiooxydans]